MGQQRTKKQHYVPQFYLKHFSSNEKVIVYDKKGMQMLKVIFEMFVAKNICMKQSG